MNRKYELMKCFDYLKDYKTGRLEVGKVVNIESQEDIMYIMYDKDIVKYSKYRACSTKINYRGNENQWVTIIGPEYLEIFRKHPLIFEFVAMHELGHFINGDLDNGGSEIDREQREQRKECIENHQVSKAEEMADIFAARELGKSRVIAVLDYTIKSRRTLGDKKSKLAIEELENRKKLIKKYNLWKQI